MASQYYGSRGTSVKEMQKKLNGMGAGLSVDGIWGKKTEAAYNQLIGAVGQAGTSGMFKRAEYTAPTDDELAQKARAAVSGEYDALETSEKQKSQQLIASLQKAIEGLDPQYQSRLDTLDKYYASSQVDISNQALKRGMGRSSLYLEMLDQNHDELISAKSQANADYRAQMDSYNEEIRNAQSELQQNLGSISARRESEIRKYIDSLTSERDKTAFEMLKYNNEIAQKEAAYYAELMESSSASSGGSGGGSSGRRRSSSKSGSSSSSYSSLMSKFNGMSSAAKVSYFDRYAASIKTQNKSAYNAMKAEVDRLRKSSENKYASSSTKKTTVYAGSR